MEYTEPLGFGLCSLGKVLFLGEIAPFSIGEEGMYLLGLYIHCQPIAGEMASVMRRKRHFPGRATAKLTIAACCLPA